MEGIELREDILKRFEILEKTATMDFDQLHLQEKILMSSIDQELMLKDLEEFELLRSLLNDEILSINKRLSYKKSLKKIKREAYKHMVEGPAV